MIFPDTPRVTFSRCPLSEVTSQIRFPPILRIQSQDPAEFQDEIRDEFPFYAVETPTAPATIPVAASKSQGVGQVFTFNLNPGVQKLHHFWSADQRWAYKLANYELSIACRSYDRWETFRARIGKGFDALVKTYQPAFFSHVCVRYKNAILRSALGLNGVSWSELLNPIILGALAADGVSEHVEKQENKFTLLLEGMGKLEATVGLGSHPNIEEKAVLIQTHVYTDAQVKASDVTSTLDSFHRFAGLFFRWCLRPRLHDSMGPTPVAT